MDDCHSQAKLPNQASPSCTAVPYFQLSLGYFYLTLLQTNVPNEFTIFSPFTLQLSSPLTSSLIFQMARPILGAFSITEFYFLFSTSSLDLYLYFYCHRNLTLLLIPWVCPSYIWVSVNVLKHYFILAIFFSEFSSDLLCVMNQVQILYLGIPRLSFSL